jgi:hypothetical protein
MEFEIEKPNLNPTRTIKSSKRNNYGHLIKITFMSLLPEATVEGYINSRKNFPFVIGNTNESIGLNIPTDCGYIKGEKWISSQHVIITWNEEFNCAEIGAGKPDIEIDNRLETELKNKSKGPELNNLTYVKSIKLDDSENTQKYEIELCNDLLVIETTSAYINFISNSPRPKFLRLVFDNSDTKTKKIVIKHEKDKSVAIGYDDNKNFVIGDSIVEPLVRIYSDYGEKFSAKFPNEVSDSDNNKYSGYTSFVKLKPDVTYTFKDNSTMYVESI